MIPQGKKGNARVATLWFGVSIYFNSALVLLATPLFTRLMTPAQYGEITLYNSLSVVVGAFATLSLYAGVFNSALLKFEESVNRLMTSMFLLVTLCSLVVWATIATAFHLFGNFIGLRSELLAFMAVQILTTAVFSFWSARERFQLSYKIVTAVSLTSSVLGVGSAAIVMMLGVAPEQNVEVRIILSALPQVLVGLFIYVRFVKDWKTVKVSDYWPYALSMGMPLIPHYLAQTFLQQFDKFAIERFVGKEELGVYGLAVAISSGLTLFWTAINTTWIPWMLRRYQDDDIESIKKAVPVVLNIVAGLAIVGSLLSPDLVSVIAPSDYFGAASIVPLMLVASFVQFANSVCLTLQFHERNAWSITMVSLASALVSVVLNIALAPIWGVRAVVGVLIFCQLTQLVLQYVASPLKVRSVVSIKQLAVLVIICGGFSVIQSFNGSDMRLWRYLMAVGLASAIVSYGIKKLRVVKVV